MRPLLPALLSILLLMPSSPRAQSPLPGGQENTDVLARTIAGDSGTSVERAQRLVNWIQMNLKWTATDYQQRTPEEIITRRGGNCAELSRVLARLLEPAKIRYRWVAEINIHPVTPRRQETAARMVQERGPRMSVFGLQHNDHRWLEIYDESTGRWIPADPAIGVIGVENWIQFRMGLGRRPEPAVPAVKEIVKDMIVPFAVIVVGQGEQQSESRSDFYLIDEFNGAYKGRLASLPAWQEWSKGVTQLSPLAAAAFEGRVNLHEHSDKIAALADAYQRLREQAKAAGLLDATK